MNLLEASQYDYIGLDYFKCCWEKYIFINLFEL